MEARPLVQIHRRRRKSLDGLRNVRFRPLALDSSQTTSIENTFPSVFLLLPRVYNRSVRLRGTSRQSPR